MTQLTKVKQNIHQHKDKSCNPKKHRQTQGPPPNRVVRTVFVNCAHWRGSTLAIYETVLIIFPLNLQTITITLDVVKWRGGGARIWCKDCKSMTLCLVFKHNTNTDVPRILQWRGFTWWGTGPEGLEDGSPQWGPGAKILGRSGGLRPPEAEAKCEISIQFLRFPVQNLGFNEYRSRAWTLYFANTLFKNIPKIQWGLNPLTLPLGRQWIETNRTTKLWIRRNSAYQICIKTHTTLATCG